MSDLLLPIVKGLGSERAWVLLGTESLQTFGGSGFLQEYPLEQYVRDAKIDTLYEGTTAIQGLDFFFRKIVKDHGQSMTGPVDADRRSSPRTSAPRRGYSTERELLGKAWRRPGHRRLHGRRRLPVRPAHRRRPHQPLQGRPEHHPPAARRR
jgi:hypothetical protein